MFARVLNVSQTPENLRIFPFDKKIQVTSLFNEVRVSKNGVSGAMVTLHHIR